MEVPVTAGLGMGLTRQASLSEWVGHDGSDIMAGDGSDYRTLWRAH